MLVVDLYSLLPAFTLTSFLLILLWPANITYRNRLRLFVVILLIWVGASLLGMAGYGTTTDNQTACFINVIVGFLGLGAVLGTYRIRPSRRTPENPPSPKD
jgi:hypothetical protein